MSSRTRVLTVAGAFLAAGLAAGALVEVWVRLTWDDKRGVPGFYVSDPVLGQRLAPGYDGWFAGVPVRINSLGFRDDREYGLEKRPGTIRILVLGDSVTFGHGARFETTYPYLLEHRLRAWRKDIDWQVWNLGVPGYDTTQELAYLEQVGPQYQPDLVIVGFYPNDIGSREVAGEPSTLKRARSAVQARLQRMLYSYEWYRRTYLTARWRFLAGDADRQYLEHLAVEDAMLAPGEEASTSQQQQLTDVERFGDDAVRAFRCQGARSSSGPSAADELRARVAARAPEIMPWLESVRTLQRLGRDGTYRVMFFINMAPYACAGFDRFHDVGTLADEAVLLELLGDGVPAVSAASEFMHYRPSQMPGAGAHSLGNANRVKADVLFEALRSSILSPPVAPRAGPAANP